MKTFFDVCRFLKSIDNIDYGGCGVSALSMYRWLKKNNKLRGDEKFVFLYSPDSKPLFTMNQKFLKGKSSEMFPASHIGLLVDGNIIDAGGVLYLGWYNKKHVISDEDVLVKSLRNYGQWNYCFKRNKNIPKISKTLEIDLDDVKIPE